MLFRRFHKKYRGGRCIYRVDSAHGPVEVWENRRLRWIQFDKRNIQTAIDLTDPSLLALEYLQTMAIAFEFIKQPKKILILGMGGGALIHYIKKNHPDAQITAVDINPDIIQVAQDYFFIEPHDAQLIIQDAKEFLEQSDQNFDLIVCDIYKADALPSVLLDDEFYQLAYQRLNKRGVFIGNFLCEKNKMLDIIRHIRHYFINQSLLIPVPKHSNIGIFGFKNLNYLKQLPTLVDKKILKHVEWDGTIGAIAYKQKRPD